MHPAFKAFGIAMVEPDLCLFMPFVLKTQKAKIMETGLGLPITMMETGLPI